ncbi:MAG TPA: glycoside hydrolase family 32 protein [Clostridiales bacterium]|nr:glycoside hydrolase family 32 protein [Clostridiales bacterium]
MEKEIRIEEEYLYLPVGAGQAEKMLEIFVRDGRNQKVKVMEFMVPVGKVEDGLCAYDYLARIPVKEFMDRTLILEGEVPEEFMEGIRCASFLPYGRLRRPAVHYTAERGWINDPNGLVYQDGTYHLYYQYNPCNTRWNNMSWGHAVSKDLLHWETKDMVMVPDEDGMIFSGSAIVNERGMLGLPKDALLFFYTAAGSHNLWSKDKPFVQKMAYSLDHGDHLVKMEEGRLDTICKENRDPKVFWHGESSSYIMCLWLEKNDFAILRSPDLKDWRMSDRFTLAEAWECPDLVRLKGEDGSGQWMFWSADGFYYWGDFDGYRFITDGKRHRTYINKLPYAAQTYSGIEDRVISVAWIRSSQEGRLYTGAMGLPRELSVVTDHGEKYLSQKPVKELKENGELIYGDIMEELSGKRFSLEKMDGSAVFIDMVIGAEGRPVTEWGVSGIRVGYNIDTGILTVGEDGFEIGKNICDFSFLLDDNIFEVSSNRGIILGVFELPESKQLIDVDTGQFETFKAYQVN